jgi:hypothetical protein
VETRATEGNSPVGENDLDFLDGFLSTAGHEKPGRNLRGPPRKAKYSLATDSELVPRGKGEKHPGRGVK